MIATRSDTHTPYAIEAAKYGIPIFLEKPVAITMEQAVSLEKAFQKNNSEVVVSFPLRVSSLCVMSKDLIDKGKIGKCEHIAVSWTLPIAP